MNLGEESSFHPNETTNIPEYFKRSMNAGYAGIENELFGHPNCLMLFGDAKAAITKLVGELKELQMAYNYFSILL